MTDETKGTTPAGTETRESFIAATVARALEPYARLLDPATLAELAALMETALDCHPVSSELVARARPRTVPAVSGEEPLRAIVPDESRSAGSGETR